MRLEGRPNIKDAARDDVLQYLRWIKDSLSERVTSSLSWNLTPSMTFGNCFSPFNRRQVLEAARISLNTIGLAVAGESDPFVRTVL